MELNAVPEGSDRKSNDIPEDANSTTDICSNSKEKTIGTINLLHMLLLYMCRVTFLSFSTQSLPNAADYSSGSTVATSMSSSFFLQHCA